MLISDLQCTSRCASPLWDLHELHTERIPFLVQPTDRSSRVKDVVQRLESKRPRFHPIIEAFGPTDSEQSDMESQSESYSDFVFDLDWAEKGLDMKRSGAPSAMGDIRAISHDLEPLPCDESRHWDERWPASLHHQACSPRSQLVKVCRHNIWRDCSLE